MYQSTNGAKTNEFGTICVSIEVAMVFIPRRARKVVSRGVKAGSWAYSASGGPCPCTIHVLTDNL
jgi:hypothetical protein